jgi:hypothetical protein
MSGIGVIGLKPWLPARLARSTWWTEPVRAERLAALRIGVGATLMLDIAGTYLPRYQDFFGVGSLTPPASNAQIPLLEWHRFLLDPVASPGAWLAILLLWMAAAACLTVGVWPRLSAGVAWLISMSVISLNPLLHNNGDQVRNILLFMLMLCPCGAEWSVATWRRTGRAGVFVYPWPLRLLFLQLIVVYFMNGLFKLRGDHWQTGQALTYLLGDTGWTRWSFAAWPIPEKALHVATWTVLAWELAFPVLMFLPACRVPALLMGVAFHIGTGAVMKIGMFPLYMLCLYLPLLPWERLMQEDRSHRAKNMSTN